LKRGGRITSLAVDVMVRAEPFRESRFISTAGSAPRAIAATRNPMWAAN
jgi:hypothetical protein